jgi:hypothetical protein
MGLFSSISIRGLLSSVPQTVTELARRTRKPGPTGRVPTYDSWLSEAEERRGFEPPLHQLSDGHRRIRRLVLTLPTSFVLPWATQGRHERALGVTDLATRMYDVARDGLNLTDGPAGAQGPREGDPGTFCQEPPFSPLLYRLGQIQRAADDGS